MWGGVKSLHVPGLCCLSPVSNWEGCARSRDAEGAGGGHVGGSSRRSWMQALLGPDGGLPMVSNIPRVNVEFLWLFLQQDLLTSPR